MLVRDYGRAMRAPTRDGYVRRGAAQWARDTDAQTDRYTPCEISKCYRILLVKTSNLLHVFTRSASQRATGTFATLRMTQGRLYGKTTNKPCRGEHCSSVCLARGRQLENRCPLRDSKMLSHFARQNEQFVARFGLFDFATCHRHICSAQNDAGGMHSLLPRRGSGAPLQVCAIKACNRTVKPLAGPPIAPSFFPSCKNIGFVVKYI